MLEDLVAAFERKDYRTAAQLLKQLAKQEPQNPWVQFYIGRLYEVTDKLDNAETAYRDLLRSTTNPKVMTQTRQALQRIEKIVQHRRQQALAEATADPSNAEQGVLILEPISSELKQAAAQKFARIMQLDAYSARLQLPSRGWRLYRVGAIGELQFYSQQLQQAEISNFSVSIAKLAKINVFNVNYFQAVAPPTIVCENEQGQLGSLAFKWSEVSQRVEGLLPIFEQVLDNDARGRLLRKTKILDYVKFCDLHLPGRNCILRLCDRNYQFNQGVDFAQTPEVAQLLIQSTATENWHNLVSFLNQQLPLVTSWSDFTPFAESAIDQTELLRRIKSHIDLFRREDTLWDQAFHLYSGLIFLRNASA
jgi:hypothetical protein